jgi:glycosyltransferase involved in cell wall biosynthesis
MSCESLGVVVIGRNEGERLERCLKSLPVNMENVVYVDSGSTDGSVEKATKIGVAVLSLDMRRPFTAARARNEGFAALIARKPNTSFVQFLDGDCELVRGWLDVGVTFLLGHSVAAVACGRRRERNPEISIYNRLCDIEWDTPVGQTLACGGDSLVRAESFNAVGGFKEALMAGEEPELCSRFREKGWEIWRLDAEMTLHDAAMTHFGQWWRRSVRSGYGYAELSQLTRHSPAGLYRREIARTIFWAGVLPLTTLTACIFHPAALAAIMIYPLQIIRIAVTRGASVSLSWKYAIYVTTSKFAELQGALLFLWNQIRSRTAQPIEYKAMH